MGLPTSPSHKGLKTFLQWLRRQPWERHAQGVLKHCMRRQSNSGCQEGLLGYSAARSGPGERNCFAASHRDRAKAQNGHRPSRTIALKNGYAERWPSGRRRTPGKCVGGEPSRGFESLSLRHFCLRLAARQPKPQWLRVRISSSLLRHFPSCFASIQPKARWFQVRTLSQALRYSRNWFRHGFERGHSELTARRGCRGGLVLPHLSSPTSLTIFNDLRGDILHGPGMTRRFFAGLERVA